MNQPVIRIAAPGYTRIRAPHPGIKRIVHKQIREHGTNYTSHNVAKLPLEFSSTIERECLKVRYGEGFGGAPLRLLPAMHRVTPGAGEHNDEPAKEPSSKPFGGDNHV